MPYPRYLKKPTVYLELYTDYGTLRISERTHSRFGNEWMGLLKSVSGRSPEFDPDTLALSGGGFSFTVDNKRPVFGKNRFSDFKADYALVNAEAHVYWAREESTELKSLYYGVVESLSDVTLETCVVSLVDYTSVLSKSKPFPKATYDDYPGMDPDDSGKIINTIYGSVRRARCLAIDAGGKSTLVYDLEKTNIDGYIGVSDASRMPENGSFMVQVDSELINIAYRDGDSLWISERGANSTEIVTHNKGAPIAEIQTEYIYLLADHPVTSIGSIYVDGIRQPNADIITYTGGGDDHPTFPNKAIVVFNTLPSIYKQTNMELVDNIRFYDGGDELDPNSFSDQYADSVIQKVFDYEGDHTHEGDEPRIHSASASCYDPFKSLSEQKLNPCDNCMCSNAQLPMWGFPGVDIPEGSVRAWRMVCTYEVEVPWASYFEVRFHPYSSGPGSFLQWIQAPASEEGTFTAMFPNNPFQDPSDLSDMNNWWPIGGGEDKYFWYYLAGGFSFSPYPGSTEDGFILIRELRFDFLVEPATGSGKVKLGETPSGTIYRVGSVELSGNSSADAVIGAVVSADCTGYPQTRPDEIRKHMLTNFYGLTDPYDTDSFDEAGEQFDSRNYQLGVVLNTEKTFQELQQEFMRQCRTSLYWIGNKEYMKFLPSPED